MKNILKRFVEEYKSILTYGIVRGLPSFSKDVFIQSSLISLIFITIFVVFAFIFQLFESLDYVFFACTVIFLGSFSIVRLSMLRKWVVDGRKNFSIKSRFIMEILVACIPWFSSNAFILLALNKVVSIWTIIVSFGLAIILTIVFLMLRYQLFQETYFRYPQRIAGATFQNILVTLSTFYLFHDVIFTLVYVIGLTVSGILLSGRLILYKIRFYDFVWIPTLRGIMIIFLPLLILVRLNNYGLSSEFFPSIVNAKLAVSDAIEFEDPIRNIYFNDSTILLKNGTYQYIVTDDQFSSSYSFDATMNVVYFGNQLVSESLFYLDEYYAGYRKLYSYTFTPITSFGMDTENSTTFIGTPFPIFPYDGKYVSSVEYRESSVLLSSSDNTSYDVISPEDFSEDSLILSSNYSFIAYLKDDRFYYQDRIFGFYESPYYTSNLYKNHYFLIDDEISVNLYSEDEFVTKDDPVASYTCLSPNEYRIFDFSLIDNEIWILFRNENLHDFLLYQDQIEVDNLTPNIIYINKDMNNIGNILEMYDNKIYFSLRDTNYLYIVDLNSDIRYYSSFSENGFSELLVLYLYAFVIIVMRPKYIPRKFESIN